MILSEAYLDMTSLALGTAVARLSMRPSHGSSFRIQVGDLDWSLRIRVVWVASYTTSSIEETFV